MDDAPTFLTVAVQQVEAWRKAPPAPQELIHADERRVLYARELLWLFERDTPTRAAANRVFSTIRPRLERLLRVHARWDGECQSLEDALMLGYAGFSSLEQLDQFAGDVRANALDGDALLSTASEVLTEAGLRCTWAGAALLVAWLTHLMWNSRLPADLRRREPSSWPEACGPVRHTVQLLQLPYDATEEGGATFARRARRAALQLARSATQGCRDEGYVRFRDAARYRRDVLATFHRINDQTTWTWSQIAREDFGSGASCGAAQAAFQRVKTMLQLEVPRGKPGRRRIAGN